MVAWFLTADASIEAVVELSGEKPRAAAIVGAAFLDTVITTVLLRRFRDGRTRDELFKAAGGRLGDTDTKAKLAYVLGIISTQALNDIRTVAEIRNKFAHRLDITTFEHPSIAELCMKLKLAETQVGPLVPSLTPGISFRFLEPDLQEQLKDARKRFVLTIKIISNGLISRDRADDQPPPTFLPELI